MISPLPSIEHSFNLKIEGIRTKRSYEGEFTFRLPNLFESGEIDKDYARFTSGLELPVETDNIYYMLAYLRHTIIKAPDWWEKEALPMKIFDSNVYNEVFEECTKFEKAWNKNETDQTTNSNS